MKKLLALLLVVVMMMTMLVACNDNSNGDPQETGNKKPSTTPEQPENEDSFDITELLPEGLNYNNTEVVICVRGGYGREIGLENTGAPLDAEFVDRTGRTEERLGVALAIDEVEVDYTVAVATIRNNITMKEHKWDIVVGWSPRLPQIAAEGLFYNLLDFDYFDSTNVWWSQSLAKELTINDRMFMATGDVSKNYMDSAHAVFFNTRLAKAMDMDYSTFYRTVSEGKWTFDELLRVSKNGSADLDGNGVQNEGDQVGLLIQTTYLQAFYTAAGVNLIPNNGIDRPQFDVNVEALELVWGKLQTLLDAPSTSYVSTASVSYGGGDYAQYFVDGKGLFLVQRLTVLTDYATNMTDGYGVLPMPKYNEEQQNYYTQLHACELWAIPVDSNDPEMSSAVMTSMGYDSHEVVLVPHFEKLLKTRYVKDSESGYMIDTIYYNIYMNFDSIYNEVLQEGNGFDKKDQMPMFMFGAIAAGNYGRVNAWWTANRGGLQAELEGILKGFYE